MPPFTLHPQLEADSVFLRDLPLSQLRLHNQQALPWLILIPRRAGIREIYQYAPEDRVQLMDEIALAAKALTDLFKPDKINIGSLGNIVPQPHFHVVARFTGDAAWPQPVWGNLAPMPYEEKALAEMVVKLGDAGWGAPIPAPDK